MSLKKEAVMGSLKSEELDFLEWFHAGRQLAIRDKMGGRENLEALLRDEVEIQYIPKTRLFVDHTGRMIPAHLGITAAVCDENRDFYLNPLDVDDPAVGFDYATTLARYKEFFPPGTNFVSVEEFAKRAEAAKKKLLENKLLSNLFNRTVWPLLIPQHEVKDMGKSMDEFFLPAAMAAYGNQFPDRKFNIYCGKMAGKILPLSDYNGHDKFIARMKNGPGVAWYFPNPMQGFSVEAQREAGKLLLSHGLLLNGAIEPVLALVGFTGEMARDFNTPGYDCPAVSWRSAGCSLYFKAYDDGFSVCSSGDLGDASACWSGGLVLLG